MASTAVNPAEKLSDHPWHVNTVLLDDLEVWLNKLYQASGRVDVSILATSNPFNCYVIWCEVVDG